MRAGCNSPRIPARRITSDRPTLLVGTALASTLLLSSFFTATPALALVDCTTQPAGPAPIAITTATDAINCVNTQARTDQANVNAISLSTTGGGAGDPHYIILDNTGILTSTVAGSGINTYTGGDYADISITNDANITAGNQGIVATTLGYDSDIDIDTEGNITAGSTAINTYTRSSFSDIPDSDIDIVHQRQHHGLQHRDQHLYRRLFQRHRHH